MWGGLEWRTSEKLPESWCGCGDSVSCAEQYRLCCGRNKTENNKAVEELGYTPNELAKQLFHNRNGIVGVMVPNLEHPFFAKMMRHLEVELSKYDYKCLACDTIDIVNRQQGFMDIFGRNMVDGIIACVDPLPEFASRKGRPSSVWIETGDRMFRLCVRIISREEQWRRKL